MRYINLSRLGLRSEADLSASFKGVTTHETTFKRLPSSNPDAPTEKRKARLSKKDRKLTLYGKNGAKYSISFTVLISVLFAISVFAAKLYQNWLHYGSNAEYLTRVSRSTSDNCPKQSSWETELVNFYFVTVMYFQLGRSFCKCFQHELPHRNFLLRRFRRMAIDLQPALVHTFLLAGRSLHVLSTGNRL